jgi:hypothetical protein
VIASDQTIKREFLVRVKGISRMCARTRSSKRWWMGRMCKSMVFIERGFGSDLRFKALELEAALTRLLWTK